MIDLAMIPKLQALWAEADAAFRVDDAYVVEMAEESAKVYGQRMVRRARREAAAQVAVEIVETVPVKSEPVETVEIAQATPESKTRRASMTDSERRERRRAQERARRARMTPEERQAFDRAKNARRVARMTPEERAAFYRASNVKAWAKRRAQRRGDVGGAS
ncbi:hypothetical protein [Microbacterium sp. BH-3-3-3]|uniref:hypothetical protein n=1 Tax=Microbacterium sp. BH-3-3-3 TaxID=1906742 RepID=UPI0011AA7021|nr:hypothetical protein [Microbacterium sp. BH-3-3-3]